MLPPMAIFFPLFTLLEDAGYLPRVAFNLDHAFRKAGAHGRQSLTMCMGLGCNACGVMGCRIIDSPRERLIAILTNSFVPCNGRFPHPDRPAHHVFVTGGGLAGSLASAALLLGAIVLAVGMTLAVSKLLSCTVLRGTPLGLLPGTAPLPDAPSWEGPAPLSPGPDGLCPGAGGISGGSGRGCLSGSSATSP